jgi:serine/threonine-protein kinase
MASTGAQNSSTGVTFDPPRRLGRYEVLAKLASGGMASVYLGRTRGVAGFERVVAIKHCHPHLMEDEEFRAMFLDEARLAARIHHPNVVPTIDVSDDKNLFLVMEYVEGGRVSDLVAACNADKRPIPVDIALRIAIDTLNGLHAAHVTTGPSGEPLNLVHRDVSPQNLIVGVDGVTRVVDFGVAKAEARATVTSENQVKGKVGYMAPEQLLMREVTARADIFSAGVVLWELLTGTRLFKADSREETIQRALSSPIVSPTTIRDGLPASVDKLIMRALCRAPSDRFETALELADALEVSAVTPASHRVVGAFVSELLADKIAARRALLRTAGGFDAPPSPAEIASGVVSTTTRKRTRNRLALVGIGVAIFATAFGSTLAVAFQNDGPPPAVWSPKELALRSTGAPAPAAAEGPEPMPEAARDPEPDVEPVTEPAEAASAPRPTMRGRPRPAMRRGMQTEFRPSTI